jgi:hypothetical protein
MVLKDRNDRTQKMRHRNNMTTNGNVISSNEYKKMEQQLNLLVNRVMANASLITERQNAFGQFGKMYEGNRDVPKAAGYNLNRTFDDYSQKYTFQGVAQRVINAPGDATWQDPPTLTDGKESDTPFINTWNKLVNFGSDTSDEISDQKNIWHYCRRIDHLSGIDTHGGMVVGINDGAISFEEPLRKDATQNIEDFLYLSPYDAANIEVKSIGTDPTNKRFSLPEMYELIPNADLTVQSSESTLASSSEGQKIHWTRVIHVAEGLKNNEIFGTPRLEAVYNLLDDLLKVTAATGESAWQLMTKGLIASTKDGFKLPADTTNIREAMETFMNELTRVLELQGMDVTLTEGEIVDPSGVIKAIISLVSAATGIPQRILLGSEAGHLASDQDEKAWAKKIMSRQINFAESVILRPLISRLIYVGILPTPTSGNYTVHWPSQLILTELEKADKLQKEMSALASAVSPDLLPLVTFLKIELGWTDDMVEAMLKNKALEKSAALIDFPAPAL